MELAERLRWALDARGRLAAARDPERLGRELEGAGLLRSEDAFELLRAEAAFELLRAAAFELLRAPAFELLRAPAFELLRAPAFELLRAPAFELLRAPAFELLRAEPDLGLRPLELAAVAPSPPAAERFRSPALGEALRFVLVSLATSRAHYGRGNEGRVPCNVDCGPPAIGGVD